MTLRRSNRASVPKHDQEKGHGRFIPGCVGCADGLLVRTQAPHFWEVLSVIRYYSGAKGAYGLNVQAIATSTYRFMGMSCISGGATNDWTAWISSSLAAAVEMLPYGYYIFGDAAYPLHDRLITPYPGTGLAPDYDSLNFHLSQLRVKVEQSFGIFVARWGILWRPLRVNFSKRFVLIRALFHLHNFCIDEGSTPFNACDENESSGIHRPQYDKDGVLPEEFRTSQIGLRAERRAGETAMRQVLREGLAAAGLFRPQYNRDRNRDRVG